MQSNGRGKRKARKTEENSKVATLQLREKPWESFCEARGMFVIPETEHEHHRRSMTDTGDPQSEQDTQWPYPPALAKADHWSVTYRINGLHGTGRATCCMACRKKSREEPTPCTMQSSPGARACCCECSLVGGRTRTRVGKAGRTWRWSREPMARGDNQLQQSCVRKCCNERLAWR